MSPDRRVKKVILVRRANGVFKDFKVRRVFKALRDRRAKKATRARKASKERPDPQVRQEPRDRRAIPVRRANPVRRGLTGSRPASGANGNWFIGDTDTGVSSSGAADIGDGTLSADKSDILMAHRLNLIDPENRIVGKAVDMLTGEVYTQANSVCSDLIPITGGNYYETNLRYVLQYDSEGEFLGYAERESNGYSIFIHEDAAFSVVVYRQHCAV